MPAPPLSNTAEGGSNGTTVTTANSGGASGSAWSVVTIGTGVAFIFTNAQSRGAMAYRITQPATFASTRVDWTALGALTVDVWTRQYIYLPAAPVTNKIHIWAARTSSALCAQMAITTGRLVEAQNAAGAAIAGGTGTVALPLNQWCRIETRTRASTTVGQFEWWQYNTADSTTADDTKNLSGLVLGANFDVLRIGQITTPGPASFVSYHDDIAISTTGALGPSGGAAATRAPAGRRATGRSLRPGGAMFPMYGWRAGRRGLCIAERRLWTPQREREGVA